ncbi:MAG: hypothetical protein OYH77_08720, partial [Pseudomonadota bacterium]|nr:hypothetical protein [Pseudomonadota bacterium]
ADKQLACALPVHNNADSEVIATLAGKEYRLRWQALTKRLTICHALDGGAQLEEYIDLEQCDTQAFSGGSDVKLLYWQGGQLKQLHGQVGLAQALQARQHSAADRDHLINSPLTGKVIAVHAAVGKTVKKGELLLVIEAMKMENRILAPADATVVAVQAELNTTVNVGAAIIKLQH